MEDIDKVIRCLEICLNDSNVCGIMCEKCQYESDYHRHCHEILMAAALELLKEQQQIVRCKDCRYRGNSLNCLLESEGLTVPDDWFCADGEVKDNGK